jgi:hypothetical protein
MLSVPWIPRCLVTNVELLIYKEQEGLLHFLFLEDNLISFCLQHNQLMPSKFNDLDEKFRINLLRQHFEASNNF